MDNADNTSLVKIADQLVKGTKSLTATAKTEDDLRIGFEKLLAPLLKELGIKSEPKYERLSRDAASAYKGRPDAVHGMVIIEYEKPGAFNRNKWIEHAHDQLAGYISAEASGAKEKLFIEDPKYIGVGFDGSKIFFTKYLGDKEVAKAELDPKDFAYDGVFDFNLESTRTFLTYLRSLSKKPLTAEHLAEAFGHKSDLAPLAVSAFADALEYWGKDRVRVFFNEWKRLFGIVYGEQFGAGKKEEAEALAKMYQVGHDTDFQELLFSVHTYFALLMKLIVLELLTLKETTLSSSYSYKLTHLSKDDLIRELADIEDGGAYAKRGIDNFLEGDFFRWYLDAWSPRLEDAIREMTRRLSDFEPATSIINPETTRDLLKKLYQYLVPQEVRHRLGEYYTPDWLAELLLEEVGYKGKSLKRFLDPACGSGTFLVLAIRKIREYSKSQKEPELETAKRVLANVWGFDLNPLAIIAARTNYLFALGDLVEKLPNIEIPIYLADSVLWPQKNGQLTMSFTSGEHIDVQTSIGVFHVPKVWIDDKGFFMREAAPLIEELVKAGYEPQEALQRLKKRGLVFPPNEDVIEGFYKEILDLEKQKKNGIWARFLKNAFAPMIAEKFDYVVGNPPWIRWDYLSDDYRKATLPLWKNYELFSLKGFQSRLGGGKKDFSMLFTYAASDYYLAPDGKLAFLITQEVFKSKGAGEGFRRFRLGNSQYLKVLKALDLVSIQPFEGATNKTAAIILKMGEKTEYPVSYFIWSRKNGVGRIDTDKLLREVLPFLQKKKQVAKPIGSDVGAWQTYSEESTDLGKIQGKNYYKAHSGAYISPYGVFWLRIKQVLSNGDLLVKNLTEKGKTRISTIEATIEQDPVYPGLRGSDIQRWQAKPLIHVLLTQDPSIREPYLEQIMKNKWPKTYSYLLKFKEILLERASGAVRDLMKKFAFYAVFGVADYTIARYKVVWKQMTNDLIASVISNTKTEFGFKTIIPLHTVALIATDDESEAHYLCTIINSKAVRSFIKSFSSAGRGFGTPSVMEHVGIQKFDPTSKLHVKLANLSKKLHELKTVGKEDEIASYEQKVDEAVNELFGIT